MPTVDADANDGTTRSVGELATPDAVSHDHSPAPVSNLIGEYRHRKERLESEQRELTLLERRIVDAAEHEAHDILATARGQVRNILLQARRDILVLTAQVDAAREHAAAARPPRHVVREVIGPARPEIAALEAEADTLRTTVRLYRHEFDDAPIVNEQPVPPAADDGRRDRFEATALADAPADSFEVAEPLFHRMAPPSRGRPWLTITLLGTLVATIGGAVWVWQTLGASVLPPAPAAPPLRAATLADSLAPQAGAAPAPPRLVLETRRPVWLRIGVGSSTDGGRIYAAGERLEFTATRVTIRAGDAGAVRLSQQGSPFEPFGRDGEALTREFRSDTGATATARPPASAVTVPRATTSEPAPAPAPPPAAAARPATTPPPSTSAAPTRGPAATAAGVAPAAVQPRPDAVPPELELVRVTESWMAAFFRHDDRAMAQAGGTGAVITDTRRGGGQPPADLELRRSVEQVKVQVVGNSAMYTGRLVETPVSGGESYVSLVSQVWMRSANGWQLLDVRIVPESNVRGVLR